MHSPADYQRWAQDPDISEDSQRLLISKPWPFVYLALAENPATMPEVLLEMAGLEMTSSFDENALLAALARHPRSGRPVLLAVLSRTVLALAREQRAYTASIELAGRTELSERDLAPLYQATGTSSTQRQRVLSVIERRRRT